MRTFACALTAEPGELCFSCAPPGEGPGALNALNRSLGEEDLYPFVLPEPVIEKPELIDELVLTSTRR